MKKRYLDTRSIGPDSFWEPEEIIFAFVRSAEKAKIDDVDMFRVVRKSPNDKFKLPTNHPNIITFEAEDAQVLTELREKSVEEQLKLPLDGNQQAANLVMQLNRSS